nr:MAG TPA: tail tape measure protein [Bacteriophage sp.]
MERLLKDAQKISGVKYNIDNLGDVYSAIHVIQEELNISGVAAEEAETTLTGSFGSMKAAAENLMANVALGESIKEPLKVLMKTINNFVVKNLIPMLGNIIASIPDLLGGLGTLLTDICNKVLEGMPAITTTAFEIMKNLATGLETNIPVAIATMMDMISQLLVSIMNSLPTFLMGGWEIIQSIILGLLNSIPSIVQGIITVMTSLITSIVANLPQFIEKGVEIIMNLITGLVNAIPDIVLAIPQIVSAIWNTLMATDWGQLGSDLIAGIANGITNAVGSLVEAAKSACSRLVDGVKSFFQIGSPSKVMAKEVGRWLPPGIADGIENNMGVVQKAMTAMNTELVGQIDTSINGSTFFGTNGNGGFTQNITIQSPKELSPSEVARQTRNKTRDLILSMRGV